MESPVKEQIVPAVKIMNTIYDDLTREFVEKDEIIRMMIVCAVGQEPMIIFGPPGTAKSAMISRFCQMLQLGSSDYFQYLLTRFTEPDELLGIVDINNYLAGEGYRRVQGDSSLQQARVVFLDEIFRGNSAILNTLLSIINERRYYEAGRVEQARTEVVYGATNNTPYDPDLVAFYARFPIRVQSVGVTPRNVSKLLNRGWTLEHQSMARRMQWEDASDEQERLRYQSVAEALSVCQRWLNDYWNPTNDDIWGDSNTSLSIMKTAFLQVVRLLNESDQFNIDDRKMIKLFKLVLAHAIVFPNTDTDSTDPRRTPTMNDIFNVVRHTWEHQERANMALKNAYEIVKAVDSDLAEQIDDISPKLRLAAPSQMLV